MRRSPAARGRRYCLCGTACLRGSLASQGRRLAGGVCRRLRGGYLVRRVIARAHRWRRGPAGPPHSGIIGETHEPLSYSFGVRRILVQGSLEARRHFVPEILHHQPWQQRRVQEGDQGAGQDQLQREQRHCGHERVAERQLPPQPPQREDLTHHMPILMTQASLVPCETQRIGPRTQRCSVLRTKRRSALTLPWNQASLPVTQRFSRIGPGWQEGGEARPTIIPRVLHGTVQRIAEICSSKESTIPTESAAAKSGTSMFSIAERTAPSRRNASTPRASPPLTLRKGRRIRIEIRQKRRVAAEDGENGDPW